MVNRVESRNDETDRIQTTDRLQIRLHHVDLPYLDARNLLEYDPDQKTISPVNSSNREPPIA